MKVSAMADNLFLGVTVGLLGSALFGKEVTRLGGTLERFKKSADSSKAIKTTVGGVVQLNRELKALERAGLGASNAAEHLRGRLTTQNRVLREAGFNTRDLAGEYKRLGQAIKGAELHDRGRARIGQAMVDAGKFAAVVGTLAKPIRVSAEYQSVVRDIAIKAGIARTPQEDAMSERITASARDNGMGRNDMAAAVNEMVGKGMDLNRALGFAPLAAKFAVGQGATGGETAQMMYALQNNAQIADPAIMRQAMEAIAYAGKAGSFESVDMARWFPELLAEMQRLGITGMDSVTQLAAMLQVQAKTAGSSDQAANNLKNWMSKIGSGETVSRYGKAGIDYKQRMDGKIAQGKSPLEASFELAREYIEKADPDKARAMASAVGQLAKESDPAKAKAMADAFAETMKTGDLFADMQVKAALTAYMQNRDLYERIKREATEAARIGKQVDKDLADRRAESKKIWDEFGQSWDNLMVKVGNALRPISDQVGTFGKSAINGVTDFAKDHPGATQGVAAAVGVGAAYIGVRSLVGAVRGGIDIARAASLLRNKEKLLDAMDKLTNGKGPDGAKGGGVGGALGDLVGDGVQKVYVTNMPGTGLGGADGLGAPDTDGKPGKPKPAPRGKGGGRLGAAWNTVKIGATKAGNWVAKNPVKAGGGLAAAGAAYQAVDTAINAKTPEEKGKGYGGAAGGLAGGLAGAKVGAAIGTVIVPGVGTAVGGVIGGLVGGVAGQAAGGKIGQEIAKPTAVQTRKSMGPPRIAPRLGSTLVAKPEQAAKTVATPARAVESPAATPRPARVVESAGGNLTVHVHANGLNVQQVEAVLIRRLDAWWRDKQKQQQSRSRGALHDGTFAGA